MEEASGQPGNKIIDQLRSEADTWGMGDHADVALPPIVTEEAMRQMDKETLIQHCRNLQIAMVQLEGNNQVLSWEVNEASDYLLRFARVAQIAHILNEFDLDKVADLTINELPKYLGCRFAAFYLYDKKPASSFSTSRPIRSTIPPVFPPCAAAAISWPTCFN